MQTASTIHASAVLVGAKAVLIRGASGSGKSRLAWQLLHSGLPLARLVGDDRVHVEARGGRLLARPNAALAGRIEVRGIGVRSVDYEPIAALGLVVDLTAVDAERLPQPGAQTAEIEGVTLPRLPVAAGMDPLQMCLALLWTAPDGS